MAQLIAEVIGRLREIFDPAAIGAMFADGVTNLFVGLIVFVVFYLGWLVVRLILRPALQRSGVDETASSFITTLAKYTILIIGIVTALDSVGIQTSAVLASLGIAGLTIGFAARDGLSNIISGILIFLDRPFVIGDLVEIEGVYGMVDRITLRSTRIITSDGKMLAVPNTEVINKTVSSYTNFPHLRLDIAVTVGVEEDLERVRRLLIDLVAQNDAYLKDPPPRVVVTQLNDYNVEMQLQAWIRDEREHVNMRFELREKVFQELTQAGVDMPFETLKITPLQVKLQDR
jgi:small conductance mechanosensitive channel